MRTSPRLGTGSFTSLSWSTSGDPYLVQTAAFMSRMLLRGDRSYEFPNPSLKASVVDYVVKQL